MSREGHKGNEQSNRESRHDLAPTHTPESRIVEHVPEGRHEPLFCEVVAFEGKFLENASGHAFAWVIS
jgi:hypothetical protein